MSSRSIFVLLPVFFCFLLRLGAEPPSATPPTRIVGTVYGKTVTAADIGLTAPIDSAVQFDARNTAQWELMGRIMTTFGKPIVDRFVKQEKVEATADEIEAFRKSLRKANEQHATETETRLAKVRADLAAPNLSKEARAKLEKEQTNLEQALSALRGERANDGLDSVARSFIVSWKTERELHRVYGGRVIFQQAGPEALDGRRRLFERAEKKGDLKFDDAGVRHLFYYYANMRHTVIDEKALEKPWFLDGEE